MITSDIKLNDGIWEAWVTFQDETKLIHIGTKVPCEQNVALLVASINDGQTDVWDITSDFSKLTDYQMGKIRKIFQSENQ
jgi:hypothetical protein